MAIPKEDFAHVEVQEDSLHNVKTAAREAHVMGTVKLTDGAIIYVPRPTADPRDPLNMPMWQKYVVMVMLSLCKCACRRIGMIADQSSASFDARSVSDLWSGWSTWVLYP